MFGQSAASGKAVHLEGHPGDFDRLVEAIGERRLVLIGDASHGTREFYELRAEITKRLIVEKGFGAVAVEADWPDAYRVHRYVTLKGDDPGADQALSSFERFPTWMWRNESVAAFVDWLRGHNQALPSSAPRTGFYGLDLYSLQRSIEAVIAILDRLDPDAARRARERYACFEQYPGPQEYGWAASLDVSRSCENEAVQQLLELRRQLAAAHAGDPDARFYAEQNARVVQNAERYYRAMFGRYVSSWNLRDTHMTETVEALLDHLRAIGHPDRIVVWEHNSHLGDARATERAQIGEVNVGQLLRERHPGDVLNAGFTTYTGTVTAASDWEMPSEIKRVRPALDGSHEQVLHGLGMDRFLVMAAEPPVRETLDEARLERAIGVVYRPESERASHYFFALLARQFDAVIHIDETEAVRPLPAPLVEAGVREPPATYPWGV